jgi:hypothetical protein
MNLDEIKYSSCGSVDIGAHPSLKHRTCSLTTEKIRAPALLDPEIS